MHGESELLSGRRVEWEPTCAALRFSSICRRARESRNYAPLLLACVEAWWVNVAWASVRKCHPSECSDASYRSPMDWYAVRSVLKNQDAYEERITLWRAASFEDAIAKAEAEAAKYAWDDVVVLPFSQSYRLDRAPQDGSEVFSLIRRSPLPPDEYLDAFFSTGDELEETIGS
jgi:hypothetical protein